MNWPSQLQVSAVLMSCWATLFFFFSFFFFCRGWYLTQGFTTAQSAEKRWRSSIPWTGQLCQPLHPKSLVEERTANSVRAIWGTVYCAIVSSGNYLTGDIAHDSVNLEHSWRQPCLNSVCHTHDEDMKAGSELAWKKCFSSRRGGLDRVTGDKNRNSLYTCIKFSKNKKTN